MCWYGYSAGLGELCSWPFSEGPLKKRVNWKYYLVCIWDPGIKPEVYWARWAVRPQSSCLGLLCKQPSYLCDVNKLWKQNTRAKTDLQGHGAQKGPTYVSEIRMFASWWLGGMRSWDRLNYKPEIFLLECSSGLLLLKPKPLPLYDLLEDPVFAFPGVMEPRCKLLYWWRQSLFLGKNSTVLERERTSCTDIHCSPKTGLSSNLMADFTVVLPTQNS